MIHDEQRTLFRQNLYLEQETDLEVNYQWKGTTKKRQKQVMKEMISQIQYCRDGSIGIIYRKSISHLTEGKNVLTTEGGKHNILAFRRKNNFCPNSSETK